MKTLVLLFTIAFAGPAFASDNELTVPVKGMVCSFCAQGIEKTFKARNEIEGIEVSLENKFVKLKFKEGQTLSKEKIGELLRAAGVEPNFGG